METKTFSVPILASITSGVLLEMPFSKMHEAAEWLLGHPVWTHEFGSGETSDRLRAAVLHQFPELDIDASSVTRDNVDEFRQRLIEDLGPDREVLQGSEIREKDPITTAVEAFG